MVNRKEISKLSQEHTSAPFAAADGWSELQRGQDGKVIASKKRFPSGIQHVADYVHSKGTELTLHASCTSMHSCSKQCNSACMWHCMTLRVVTSNSSCKLNPMQCLQCSLVVGGLDTRGGGGDGGVQGL